MSEVHVNKNESLESALKRFKRQCARAGVLAEVRKREHYEKPSVKRKKMSLNCRLLHRPVQVEHAFAVFSWKVPIVSGDLPRFYEVSVLAPCKVWYPV